MNDVTSSGEFIICPRTEPSNPAKLQREFMRSGYHERNGGVTLHRPKCLRHEATLLHPGQARPYDVTRGGRFLINTVLDDAASPITLLLNWKPKQ